MGKALLVSNNGGGTTSGSGSNRFTPGAGVGVSANRADAAQSYQVSYFGLAGTIVDFSSKWDSVGTGRTLSLRQNTVGTTTVQLDIMTATDTTAGIYTGAAEPLSIAAGTLLYESAAITGAPNPLLYWARIVFQAAANHSTVYAVRGSLGPAAHDTTLYQPLGGTGDTGASNATELISKELLRAPGTLANLHASLGNVNGNDYTVTVTTRINGAPGNQSVSIAGGVTGKTQDTSNSDTVVPGDYACFQVAGGAGTTGSAQPQAISVTFANTSGNINDLFCSDIGGNNASSTTGTQYCPAVGRINTFRTDETLVQVQSGFASKVTNLRCYLTTNTWTAAGTVTFRVNAGNGNQSISIGAGLTGFFEDVSGSDRLAPADDISIMVVATGTTGKNASFRRIAITQQDVTVSFDAASGSGYQTAQATYSWAHTCTGSNRYLVVSVSMLSVAGSSVSSITYNGVAMTLLGTKASVSGAVRVELWGLANPASGSNTIAVTLSAGLDSVGSASSYTNVHQTLPTEGFASASATNVGAADATVNVTTLTNDDMVVDVVGTDDTAITVGAGQVSRNNQTGALGSGAMSTEGPKNPLGTVTMSWTAVGALATWSIASIGLVSADAIGPTTGTSTGTGTATSVGASTAAATAASTGIGAATGIGAETATGAASSTGAATATGVGAETTAGVASSTGVGTAAGVGALNAGGVAEATGTGTAAAIGASTAEATAASAGVGVADGIGAETAAGLASSTGTGTAASIGIALAIGAASSAGIAAVTGVGAASATAAASAGGVGTATGVGRTTAAGLASSAGIGVALGIGAETAAGSGSSTGAGTASGAGYNAAGVIAFRTINLIGIYIP